MEEDARRSSQTLTERNTSEWGLTVGGQVALGAFHSWDNLPTLFSHKSFRTNTDDLRGKEPRGFYTVTQRKWNRDWKTNSEESMFVLAYQPLNRKHDKG